MPKYELSVAPDYVPSWGIVDAVREFFQNAVDQQNTVEGNDMFFNYDADNQVLTIGNKRSVLEAKTLLLGNSTKAQDKNTIGQFGEGYKIASLVLVRNNKKVTFYNYGAREVWRPRFSRSQKYKTTILVFDVDRKYVWSSVPNNDLTITIEGITPEEYEDILESNLHLQDLDDTSNEVIQTEFGRILLNNKYASKVYVHGLYVCANTDLAYGYDFKPEYLSLGRDRALVDNFNLYWLTSRTWRSTGRSDLVHELVKKGTSDVKYINEMTYDNNTQYRQIAQDSYAKFRIAYGEKAVPVSSQAEAQQVEEYGFEPIVVTEVHKKLVEAAPQYNPPRIQERSFEDLMGDWLNNNIKKLSDESLQKMYLIVPNKVNEILQERNEECIEMSKQDMVDLLDKIHGEQENE